MSGPETGIPGAESNPVLSNEPELSDDVMLDAGEINEASDPEEPELEEIDLDGKKYKLPKDVKPHLLRQADYTRKTQELAEQRKAIEAEKVAFAKTSDEIIQARGTLAAIDQSLEQWKNVDWDKYESEDPLAAAKAWRQYQQLQNYRESVSRDVQAKQASVIDAQRQEVAKRIEDTRRFAETEIKGWTPEIDAKVTAFAKEQGLTDQQLIEVINPVTYKLLHLAWVGSQRLTAPQSQPSSPPPAPAPVLEKVGRSAPAVVNKLSDRASVDDWMKARQAQVARQR